MLEGKEPVATIAKEQDILTLVNVFTVKPDDQQTLVQLLIDATEQTMEHLPGFISASIHKSQDGTKVVNYAQWRSQQDFDAMRQHPKAKPHMVAAAALATFEPILCEVVESIAHALIDSKRIVILYTQLLEAWNQRNADEFAALFAEDGSSVGFDGSPMNGRAEIAATLNDIFANHPTATYVAQVREIRRLGAEAFLLRSVVGMVPPGETELNPAVNTIQIVVIVEQGGQVKIALLQNTPAAFHGRPQLAEQLTEELTAVLRSGRIVSEG